MEEQRSQRGCIAGRMPAGLSPRAVRTSLTFENHTVGIDPGLEGDPECWANDFTFAHTTRHVDSCVGVGFGYPNGEGGYSAWEFHNVR
jgi:hypothetical protein